jgi:hypothetical protein
MKLSKLSPTIHDALLTVGKKASSYSPGLRSPAPGASFGRFAYESSAEFDCNKTCTVYSTEEPTSNMFKIHDMPKKKVNNLKLITKLCRGENNNTLKTAPTPRIRRTSPASPTSSSKQLYAFVGNTYEYKFDGWKDDVQHWKDLDVPSEPTAPNSHVETIKPKKTGLGSRIKTVFFQQQLNHGPLPPQHLGRHEVHL